jgi:hypothetical protein
MSQTLEIPDTLYTALKEAAEARGLTPVAWIAAHLQHAESETESQAKQASGPGTLADLFVGRVGRIRSGGREQFSEECGAKFTDYLEEKRKAGHL